MHPPGCASEVCKPTEDGGWTDFVAPRDLYNEAPTGYVYTPSSRQNLFATAGNRLGEHSAWVVELLYLSRKTHRQLSPVAFVADSPISKDAIYNPLGGDIVDYQRRITELGPRQCLDDLTVTRLVFGLTGSVPESVGVLKDWKYELSYNFGRTEWHLGTTGQLLKPRVADALGPSMRDANGVPICVRTPGDPDTQIVYNIAFDHGPRTIPCVPLNVLAPAGSIPRDQLQNLTFEDGGLGTDQLRTLLATAGGRIAKLPQGDISLSLGGDYRDDDGVQFPPDVALVGN